MLHQFARVRRVAFGVPQFICRIDGYEERIYRLPGAWVTVEPVDDAVRAFTITITEPDMYYATKGMTFGLVDVRLGKDTFDEAQRSGDDQFAIGARHATYVRHYGSNNPSGFQEYWLAFNVVGAGSIVGGTHRNAPDPAGITANTLTVLSPEGNQDHADHIHKRTAQGPHMEQLRLLWTERERLYR